MEPVILLDPTNEASPVMRQISPRPKNLSGRVGFLDISKRRGDVFLNRLEESLVQRVSGIEINRYEKPTFSKPAPELLRQEIKAANDFVVVALAD